ncbi:MAG: hypothetical protein ACJAT1_001394, partial [Marivirga sp.]
KKAQQLLLGSEMLRIRLSDFAKVADFLHKRRFYTLH